MKVGFEGRPSCSRVSYMSDTISWMPEATAGAGKLETFPALAVDFIRPASASLVQQMGSSGMRSRILPLFIARTAANLAVNFSNKF